MSLRTYNKAEIAILESVRAELKWHLGVELGRDPEDSSKDLMEVEMRLARWLTNGGGGAWMASMPHINNEK